MIMSPRWSRFVLLTHIVTSVGWVGAVAAYIVLTVIVVTNSDPLVVRGALLSMQASMWYAIFPLSIAALVSGLIQSLGTRWGLFVHYWVIYKLVLTVVGIIVMFMYTDGLDQFAAMAKDPASQNDITELQSPSHLMHPVGGLVVLLATVILSVYKPKGMTAYGRRKQQRRRPKRAAQAAVAPATA
jgi:hypothetical protein